MISFTQHHLALWTNQTAKKNRRMTKKERTKRRRILDECLLFFGGSLLGSDLQVVCVWCVVSFVFFSGWGGGVFLSQSVFPVAIAQPPKTEKQGGFKWFLVVLFCFCRGVFQNPQRSPWPKRNTTKKEKGAGLVGPERNRIKQKTKQNNNTSPQQKVGKGYVAVWSSPETFQKP